MFAGQLDAGWTMLCAGAKVVALPAFFLMDFLLYGALTFTVVVGLHLAPLPLVQTWTATLHFVIALSIGIVLASYRGTIRIARRCPAR